MKTWFKSGSWNAVCDVCGFRFKSDQMKRRWDNLMVCHQDYETDHPQKYLRVRETGVAVPWIRREPSDTGGGGGGGGVCTIYSVLAYADVATADCCQADNTSIPYASIPADQLTVTQGTFI
jgi:hypothetical protein